MSVKLKDACKIPYKKLVNAMQAMPLTGNKERDAKLVTSMFGDLGKKKTPFMNKVVAAQINSMLSGLGTPVANALSTAVKLLQTPINDLVEVGIRKGKGEDVYFGEVAAAWKEAVSSFGTAVQMGRHGWDKGYPLDIDVTMRDMGMRLNISTKEARTKVNNLIMQTKAEAIAKAKGTKVSDELAALNEAKITPTDAEVKEFINDSYDYMRNVFDGPIATAIYADKWATIPTKATVAIDEFGKSLFRMYKIGQLVSRKARKDAKSTGGDYKELYDKYMKEATQDAMEGDASKILSNLERNLGKVLVGNKSDMQPYNTVKEYALREMFQERLTGMPRTVHESVQKHPSMRFFIPFMKTPWNISKEAVSYFPGVAQLLKKSLPARFKEENGIEVADLTKQGAYYDLSYEQMAARQMVGLGYFAGIMSMFDSEEITGSPRNAQEAQAWRDQGKPQQSIRIGDTWINYGRVEPIATVIQMAGELRRVSDDYYNNPDPEIRGELDVAMKGLMWGIKNSIMDKTFIAGFNDMVDAGLGANPQGVADSAVRQAIPAIVNQAARVIDPKERQATTVGEKAKQRIPFLRETLPEEYGLYGGAREGNTSQEITSVAVSDASKQTPLQKAMIETQLYKTRPSDKLKGVGLNNEQLADYRRHIATSITGPLERYVEAEGFQRLPAGIKQRRLGQRIDKLKRRAINQYYVKLRRNDPEMAAKFRNAELSRLGRWDEVEK